MSGKNIIFGKKYCIWNPSACNWETTKYLRSIIDDSVIMCDEIIESYDKKIKATNFLQQILMKKKT